MNKIDHILTILQLLYGRKYVRLSTIENTCGVSKRTAFRYIATIRDAGIPVCNDNHGQGYYLRTNETLKNKLTKAEAALMYLGTILIERFFAGESLRSLKSARVKLEAVIPTGFRETIEAGRHLLVSKELGEEGRSSILIALLLLAEKANNTIEIVSKGEDERPEKSSMLRMPHLALDKFWYVADKAGDSEAEPRIRIDDIIDLRVGDAQA